MNQRERILLGAVGLLALFWGATVGWDRYQTALTINQNQQQSADQQLSQARTASARGLRAERLLRGWRRQSLPTNVDIAKSLYQDWLRQQLVDAGLVVREITETSSRSTQKHFSQVTYVINAQGTLGELTEFLYRFYQSNQLHRVSSASLTPTTTRKSLTVSLTIDALSLADCPRSNELAAGSSETFVEPLETVRDGIVSRNVFVAYAPAQQEQAAEQEAEGPDETAQAFLTGMTYGEGGWQLAIRMSDSGQVRYYRQGDSIEIGRFSGEIVDLDGRRAIVSRNGQRMQIQLGQNLGQAVVISDHAG